MTSGVWDFTPLLAALAFVFIARSWIGLRVSPGLIGAAAVAGLLFADFWDRWGFALSALVALLAAASLSYVVRRERGR